MSAAFLRKYATATTSTANIRIPIIKRAVVDFAVSADWTPAAGDVKVSKDGGAAANIGTLPTAVTMGNTAYWEFTLTGTELTAKTVVVTVADSATKAVEDQAFVIETYGHASALYAVDFDDSVRFGMTALPNAAAAASGGVLINGSNTGTVTLAALTVTGAQTNTGGIVGNITGNLSGSVGSVTGATGSVTGAVGSVTGSVGSIASGGIASTSFAAGAITAAAIADAAIDTATFAAGATIPRCTLADTLTTYTNNTPQTGNVYTLVDTEIAALTAAVAALPTATTITDAILVKAVPTSNTSNTIADCLNAARAQGFGKWAKSGTSLILYAPDGTTIVRTFTLDSATAPTTRE